jgi:hypothetical protein
MGWGSAGHTIFNPVARALREAGAGDELVTRTLAELIPALQDGDWDTELDSLQVFLDDPAVVAAFAAHGFHWDEEPTR